MSFIPMTKADTDILEKQQREINRRRKAEQERKQYFFNDKKRRLGVDVDFIAKQIAEKKQVKDNEIEAGKEHRAKIDSFVERLSNLDIERNKYYSNKRYETGEYQKHTLIENRDTWDLNDPLKIRKDTPPRIDDNQNIPTCAIQKFDGEDLKINDRIKQQQKQLKIWCNEIINEKNMNIQNEKELTSKYIKQRNEYLNELKSVENNKCVFEKKKCINYGKTLNSQIMDKQQREKQCKQIEANQSEKEIKNMIKSEFLNETWDSTIRNNNQNRFIPYNFKGFSQDQRQKILNKQQEQIKENINHENVMKEEDYKYYKQQQNYSRKALLQLRHAQRLQQQRKCELAAMHKQQMAKRLNVEQKEKEEIDQQVRKNGDYFFQQFQKSTR
eukprot:485865_1